MSFTCIMRLSISAGERQVELMRTVVMPFPPYIGLAIDFLDEAPSDDVHVVQSVTWNVSRGDFEVHCEPIEDAADVDIIASDLVSLGWTRTDASKVGG